MSKTPKVKLDFHAKTPGVPTHTLHPKTIEKFKHHFNKSLVEIEERLQVIQAEWPVERWNEIYASYLVVSGLHVMQPGFCPPFPFSRKQARLKKEIEEEICVLNFFRSQRLSLEYDMIPVQ